MTSTVMTTTTASFKAVGILYQGLSPWSLVDPVSTLWHGSLSESSRFAIIAKNNASYAHSWNDVLWDVWKKKGEKKEEEKKPQSFPYHPELETLCQAATGWVGPVFPDSTTGTCIRVVSPTAQSLRTLLGRTADSRGEITSTSLTHLCRNFLS